MRQLSSAVIGCAGDIAINAFNAGDLNLLFLRAGLKPEYGYGKSALVSNGITAAVRAADTGDRGAKVGLNEFVRLVAERVAPRAPDNLIQPGTAFWRLRRRPGPTGSTWVRSTHQMSGSGSWACGSCRWTSRRHR